MSEICRGYVNSHRQALLDALDEPCKGIFPFGKDDVVLQDVVEIDVQATVVIENGDGPAAIDVRPEIRLHAVRMGWRCGRLAQHRAPLELSKNVCGFGRTRHAGVPPLLPRATT